ncbi:glycoside hydrolase family 20 zincin-like fold domain-containing protein [Niabella hibiscisoli]|uniref:glycoside hydrolase family 20 zincin-like fold domain-containing protein n=1 Tax=Niabella hibiscisoli TaxID=1825928 RepID=UPI001F0D8302|nr:glycoside hydrolase family 20 zincin-like fold domain-containing protein [Niabella hibiscisoli]MCH5718385.1 glycoside hydrolase family 20 zincin-like fold domain-containing protein [Niabella hibiscisoli]
MRLLFFLSLFLIVIFYDTRSQGLCPVIPQPVHANQYAGNFLLSENTALVLDDAVLQPVAWYLKRQLLSQNHCALAIRNNAGTGLIKLSISKKGRKDEAYDLMMNSKQVHISGETEKGVFTELFLFAISISWRKIK